MQFKEFDYDVFVMVEISGQELLFLREHAKHHYDGVCKSVGEVGGFLYGFINQWMFASDDTSSFHNKRTDLDRIEVIRMSGREIDTLAKICEIIRDPHPILTTFNFIQLLNKRKEEYERVTHANI